MIASSEKYIFSSSEFLQHIAFLLSNSYDQIGRKTSSENRDEIRVHVVENVVGFIVRKKRVHKFIQHGHGVLFQRGSEFHHLRGVSSLSLV